jgi:hypothetical protein
VFVSLYYLVCSSNKFTFFVLRFFFGSCSRLFSSFPFVPFIALSVKNNFLWWVVNHCPLFFVSCSFIFYPLHRSLFKFFKLVDNSSPGIELSLKNIHSICILQTTAIRHHHHHQSQTPRLDWSSLSRLRFVSNFVSPPCLLVIPSFRRLPSSITLFHPLVLSHCYSTQSTSLQLQ